jgi:hypothetical protein
MNRKESAEVAVLDRLMYMLEENSVNRLTREDNGFETFIDGLYETIQVKAEQLSRESPSPVKKS